MESQDRHVLESEPSQAGSSLHKLAYSIYEAAEVSGLSRAFIYAEWQAGRGPRKVKAGKRTLILDEALRSWLRSLECKAVA
jgi:predicted DNA-binding transcriptional regulator AlpA